MKAILYYSHNNIDGTPLNDACRKSLLESGLPITSVTHEPIAFGRNIVVDRPRSLRSMLENIVQGLESMTEDYIYLAEHDCIYNPTHYDYESDEISCNVNSWRLTCNGFYKHPKQYPVLSSYSGPRNKLLEVMRRKLARYILKENKINTERRAYAPFIFEPFRSTVKRYESKRPIVDARHQKNSASGVVSKRWEYRTELPSFGKSDSFYKHLQLKDHPTWIHRRNRQILGRYKKFVVTGPQRSGTRIYAKIISDMFGIDYIDERDFKVHYFKKMEELINGKDSFCVQCPALTHRVFELPKDICIIVVRRDTAEIMESERRINWDKEFSKQEKQKFNGLGLNMNQPVCKLKYDYIDKNKDSRTIFINYGAFSNHPLWVAKEKRVNFKWNQTG